MAAKLKKCFCGGKARAEDPCWFRKVIVCVACGRQVKGYDWPSVIKQWNAKPTEYALAWRMWNERVTASKRSRDLDALKREALALEQAGAVYRLVDDKGHVVAETAPVIRTRGKKKG